MAQQLSTPETSRHSRSAGSSTSPERGPGAWTSLETYRYRCTNEFLWWAGACLDQEASGPQCGSPLVLTFRTAGPALVTRRG